jgi:hypothetical protein
VYKKWKKWLPRIVYLLLVILLQQIVEHFRKMEFFGKCLYPSD